MAGQISAGDLSSFIYAVLVASSTGFLSELAGDLQRCWRCRTDSAIAGHES